MLVTRHLLWSGMVLLFLLGGCKKKGPQTHPATPLMKQLKSEEADKRKAAAEALGRLGPKARPAIPALANVLKNDEDNQVRYAAAAALGRTKLANPQVAMRALTLALKSSDADMRLAAVKAIGNMGLAGLPAVSILRVMERDQDEDPRVKAAIKVTLRSMY
ncbi:MAG: HEAT repeat domain-containing protein [Deltaproteobacteria bacterium]|nr:MAG: HEAT repeat domain-containing protein [Deltaproteobacteria bacterium]